MKQLSIELVASEKHHRLADFVVSGKSLMAELERRAHYLVPRLSSGRVPVDQRTRAHLLLEEKDDLPDGRVALYTCPCGDYGCGVVSVRIEDDGDCFIWSEFRYETTWDEGFDLLERLGPLKFEKQAYRDAILHVDLSD